jgi:hypothetical protein
MYFDRQPKQFGEELPPEVQAAFHAYRESLPDFEGSADFMPKLWERIESEQRVGFSLSRLTRALVPVSACLCAMTFAVAMYTPVRPNISNQQSSATWVEVLAEDTSEYDATAI